MTAMVISAALSRLSALTGQISHFIPRPMLALADAAARGLLVATVVWAGLSLLRARNVVTQKATWCLVLFAAALMPVIAPWASGIRWLPAAILILPTDSPARRLKPLSELPGNSEAAMPVTTRTNAASYSKSRNRSALAVTRSFTLPAAPAADPTPSDRFPSPTISKVNSGYEKAEPPRSSTDFSNLLTPSLFAWLLYTAVCGVLLLRLLHGAASAFELWDSAEPAEFDSTVAIAAGLHIRHSRRVASPVTVGGGIILPSDYDEWDPGKLRIVLAHERSHVRQGDFYLQFMAGLYAALFWFSPLGWWLRRKLSDLAEAISDRAGLEEAASRASYAQVLLQFAALEHHASRRTQLGVAMARTGSLTHRVERLLNENRFRQAFTASRIRLAVALMLVPAALFGATALIRVEAAGQGKFIGRNTRAFAINAVPAKLWRVARPVLTGDFHARSIVSLEPAPAPAEPSVPAVAPAPAAAPSAAPQAMPVPAAAPQAVPVLPQPPQDAEGDESAERSESRSKSESDMQTDSRSDTITRHSRSSSSGRGYAYSYSSDGDSYAVITGKGDQHMQFSGDWFHERQEELEKARKMAHGDFLWFTHNGKSYILDNPSVVARVQEMYRPMEELGKKQEELGRQQEVLGKEQEEIARRHEKVSIPAPDLSKEMAALNAEVAKLGDSKGGSITQEQLSELQGRIGELQGKLGSLQGDMGSRVGEFGRQQGELGARLGALGAQQGRLGAEQGRLAREADQKVKSIINESLQSGKAKPVQ